VTHAGAGVISPIAFHAGLIERFLYARGAPDLRNFFIPRARYFLIPCSDQKIIVFNEADIEPMFKLISHRWRKEIVHSNHFVRIINFLCKIICAKIINTILLIMC